MSSSSIFGSSSSENRWQEEMSFFFPRGQVARWELGSPPCVFRVPESLTQTKPEAYAPQTIGLGPYHHLRPDLYTMQRKKLDAVLKFLDDEQLQNFQAVVDDFMTAEPFIRESYDQYLDLDPRTLSWIFAIDVTYLVQFLRSYPGRNAEDAAENQEMKKLAGDILMLENQIPLFLLRRVSRFLELCIGPGDEYSMVLPEFVALCKEVSPLKLKNLPVEVLGVMTEGHPLSVMYRLIVTNRGGAKAFPGPHQRDEFLESSSSGGTRKVHWYRILGLFNSRKEIKISPPPVSQLTQIAGIRFAPTAGGIRDVEFHEEEKKFYLPLITLHSNSEVILRNLLAYEAVSTKPGSSALELAEYVDLMCGIVNTRKDVEILRKEKIIEGDLTDAEIATIFNGIRQSSTRISIL